MSRPKTKFGQSKLYYLEDETIEDIKVNAGSMQLSASSYIDFLVKKDKINTNPTKIINKIVIEKQKIKKDLEDLEKKETEEVNKMNKLYEWQQLKKGKKEEALVILKKIILTKDFSQAESVAKFWQKITGISAIELLMDAKGLVEKEGI